MLRFSPRCQDFFLLPFLMVFSAFGQIFSSCAVPFPENPTLEGRDWGDHYRHVTFCFVAKTFPYQNSQSSGCFTKDVVLGKKKTKPNQTAQQKTHHSAQSLPKRCFQGACPKFPASLEAVTGQGGMTLTWQRAGLNWILKWNSSLWGWEALLFPEKMWVPHLHKRP